MNKELGVVSKAIFIILLSLSLVLPVLIETSVAQAPSNYYVGVSPLPSNSSFYTPMGSTWNVSFQALWSYGVDSGQLISNATVAIQVSGSKSGTITTLNLNTTEGLFSFNYSSSIAEIITFKPAKLVTQNGTEYKPSLLEIGNTLFGLQSESLVVWWDSFHVSLASYDVKNQGTATVTVNVTYLLLPEDGLTLPATATYSHQTFLPKVVHNATITIDGVTAEEISTGLFKAKVPIWLPTAYVHVGVSQEGWITTHTGFSFAHNANEPIWEYAVLLGLLFAFVGTMLVIFKLRKSTNNSLLQKNYRFAVLGGALLAITSIISLYWGLVGLDSTLHGFDWTLLTTICFMSFGFGLTAGILSILRRNQTLVIFAVVVLIFTNLVGVKSSLDLYELTNPWLILIGSFVLSVISGFLVSNADEAFNSE